MTCESTCGLTESDVQFVLGCAEVDMQDEEADLSLSEVLYYVIGATCVIGLVLVGCGYLFLR